MGEPETRQGLSAVSGQPSAAPGLGAVGKVAPPSTARTDGIGGISALDEQIEHKLDEIEMIGEEEAAGFDQPLAAAGSAAAHGRSDVTPGMRYLHCSRTIHQLVTDRNRAVGLYVAVASLLWTASSAIINANPDVPRHLPVPFSAIQQWCLPGTFAVLTVLAIFVGLLLIRTRIGLIYEVAKMNVLLGLPVGRVKRVNPLSIFFIMHTMISLAGGCAGALFAWQLLYDPQGDAGRTAFVSVVTGVCITAVLLLVYIGTVLHTTSDRKLQRL